jgi:hypothetical protein
MTRLVFIVILCSYNLLGAGNFPSLFLICVQGLSSALTHEEKVLDTEGVRVCL